MIKFISTMQFWVREPVFPVSAHDKCDEQGNTIWRLCDQNESEGSEQIYDLTGVVKQNSSVTNREENTRSHPEHGRKDSLRQKYLEGHLPGR